MIDREARIDAAIAEYLAASPPPNREAFLAKHAEFADSLREFIDDHERMRNVAQSSATETMQLPANPAFAPTLSAGTAAIGPLGTVRYIGDFELLEEIARGAMGVVYKARQVSLNRVVALKMILAGRFASATDVQRFRQEAEAAANIDHPNVLPIYEVGEHEGHQYFAMKLVSGGNLASQVERLVGNPREAVTLLEAVARGVHFAHQRGIMHRDLKPANVLLDADGTPFIADFGLAKKSEGSSSLTQSGAIVGTPSYMAPEQARGSKSLTTAVDTYALGAILYELLTGAPPFRGDSIAQTLRMVEEQEPVAPRKLNPAANADLEAIALKCLQKEPARRYESAAAFADDLSRWLRGGPVSARRAGSTARAWKWVRRNPAVAGLSAAVVLTMIAGSITSALYAVQSRKRADLAAANERDARTQEATVKHRERVLREVLYQSTFQQARALRLAGRPGWRERSLQLLDHSADLLRQSGDTGLPRDRNANLPELAEVRGEVVNCLLASDATVARRITLGFGGTNFLSGDGRKACVVSSDNAGMLHVLVADLETGKELKRLQFDRDAPRDQRPALKPDAISLDGSRLACSADSFVRIHDTMTGQLVATCRDVELEKTKSEVELREVRFSPNGQRIAVIRIVDKVTQVVMWNMSNLERPQLVYSEKLPGEVEPNPFLLKWSRHLRFSPDSRRISFVDTHRKSVKAFDINNGAAKPVFEIERLKGVDGFEWSPEGALGAVIEGTSENHFRVSIWDLATTKSIATCDGDYKYVPTLSYSQDGAHFAVAARETPTRVFAATDGDELLQFEESDDPSMLAWTPAGEFVANDPLGPVVWKLSFSDRMAQAFRSHFRSREFQSSPVGGLAFSPDGRWIAMYRRKGQGKPDDASINDKDVLELIDRQTGRIVKRIQEESDLTEPAIFWAEQLFFSPDSRRIAHFDYKAAIIRDVESGKIVQRLKPSKTGLERLEQPFYAADGRLLGVGARTDKPAFLWDFDSQTELAQLEGIGDWQENWIIVPSADGTHLLIHPTSMKEVMSGKVRLVQPTFFEIPSGKRVGIMSQNAIKDKEMCVPVAFDSVNRHVFTMSFALGIDGGRTNLLTKFRWDLRQVPDGEVIMTGEVPQKLPSIGIGPDPNLLLVGDDRDEAVLWSVENKEKLMQWQPYRRHPATFLRFTPDGFIAAISDKGELLTLLDLKATRQRLRTMGLDW